MSYTLPSMMLKSVEGLIPAFFHKMSLFREHIDMPYFLFFTAIMLTAIYGIDFILKAIKKRK